MRRKVNSGITNHVSLHETKNNKLLKRLIGYLKGRSEKRRIMRGIVRGLQEVKDIRPGKKKAMSFDEL